MAKGKYNLRTNFLSRSVAIGLAASVSMLAISPAMAQQTVPINIPAQSAPEAITRLARQTGTQILFDHAQLRRVRTRPVNATVSPREAVRIMLEGSGFEVAQTPSGALVIRPIAVAAQTSGRETTSSSGGAPPGSGEAETEGAAADSEGAGANAPGYAEILVVGRRTLNTDIQRTENDAQPYVVFGRDVIDQSGSANVEDFVRQRLPMNAQAGGLSQSNNVIGSTSTINLRGLGANQTLILVDGRRLSGASVGGSPLQPDLNSIPLAAIERIEVLPTTASGIYGGGATGGVVNVILRRDYSGVEVRGTYENTFDSDTPRRQVDVAAGISLEGGRTNILLAASHSDTDPLLVRDRDFVQRGRAAILSNRPAAFLPPAAPPLGATTNIRSANGSPLFGPGTSNFTSVPVGYAGGGGLAPLQANAGRYNFDLPDSAQSSGGGRQGLLNGPIVNSLLATVRRRFSDSVTAYVDFFGSENRARFPASHFAFLPLSGITIPASAPNNPFGQAIVVTVPTDSGDSEVRTKTSELRLSGGLILRLPNRWGASFDYTWNRTSNTQFQPRAVSPAAAIASGALDVLRDTSAFPLNFSPFLREFRTSPLHATAQTASLRVGGPTVALPGGPIVVNALLEYRDEQFADGRGTEFLNSGPGTPFIATGILLPKSQVVRSGYVEAHIPLFSERNARPGFQLLELQLAARRDEYEITTRPARIAPGSTAPVAVTRSELSSNNPTVALRYKPIQSLLFRASYGTGFLPPAINQLSPNAPFMTSGFGAVDPRRGNEAVGTFEFLSGGNPDLQPEESTSWSAGVVFEPAFLPGARFSVDYTNIRKTNNIVSLSNIQFLLDNEASFPGRVVRAAPAPGDPFPVGRITSLNGTFSNIAETDVEAYDLSFDYTRETERYGVFSFFFLGTLTTKYRTQITPTSPQVDNVGITSSFPLRFRANAGLTWRLDGWTVGWSSTYFDSYRLSNPIQILNQGSNGRVRSQTYHNAFVSYRFGRASGDQEAGVRRALAGTEIQLGITNIFGERPPFDASNLEYFYSPFGSPRLSTYYLTVKRSF